MAQLRLIRHGTPPPNYEYARGAWRPVREREREKERERAKYIIYIYIPINKHINTELDFKDDIDLDHPERTIPRSILYPIDCLEYP